MDVGLPVKTAMLFAILQPKMGYFKYTNLGCYIAYKYPISVLLCWVIMFCLSILTTVGLFVLGSPTFVQYAIFLN